MTKAVLFMAVVAMTERQGMSQSSGGGGGAATNPEMKQVFSPPTEAELSKVERPELRLELLKMVSEDQVARSTGT